MEGSRRCPAGGTSRLRRGATGVPSWPRGLRTAARGALLLIALVVPAARVLARDWHVDDTGPVTSGCSGGTSIADALRTIQQGVECMSAGDTVLVHAGSYAALGATLGGRRLLVNVLDKSGGGPSSRYTIRVAGDGTVTLDGAPAGLHGAIYVLNSPYVTVDGFVARGFASGAMPDPRAGVIEFVGSSHGEALNNRISGSVPSGEASEIGFHRSYHGTVSGNVVASGIQIGIAYEGTTDYSSPTINTMDTGVISGNWITHTTEQTSPEGPAGMFIVRVDGTTIWNNYLAMTDPNKHPSNASRGLYIRDNQRVRVLGNVVSGYLDGMQIQDTNQVDSCGTCVSARLDPNGNPTFNEHEQHVIVNNVFDNVPVSNPAYDDSQGIVEYGGHRSCDGCIVKNNIFVNSARSLRLENSDPSLWPDSGQITNNIFFGAVVASIIQDAVVANNVTGDPLFLGGAGAKPTPYYLLSAGSPAINLGDNAHCAWIPSDGLCDAGAYEFAGVVLPTCSQLGGVACATGELCAGGAFQVSSDAGALCCVGGACTEPSVCADADGDGYGDGCPLGPDCDDGNGSVHPGAAEVCNGFDDDCDSLTDEGGVCTTPPVCVDADGDGYGDNCAPGPDCDDGNGSVHPGAAEVCNGADDDCDGLTDEDDVCTPGVEAHFMEAEDAGFALEMETIQDAAASGGVALRPRAGLGSRPCGRSGPLSVLDVSIAHPGFYHLWVRMKGTANANDALCVGFPGRELDRVFPSSLGGYQWIRAERINGSGIYTHNLGAGLYTVMIGLGEELARIDAVCLTNDLTAQSPPCGEGTP